MRVLPVGTDYAGDRFVEGQDQAYRPGYRRTNRCEYLPLWNVSTHSRRNQSCLGGKRMSPITNVSRRGFLKGLVGGGALVRGAYYLPKALRHHGSPSGGTDADRATLHPNLFVGIDTDGTVYIVAHRSEMGTVIRTTLPMVVADELDADWKRIKIDQAIGDPRYGDQNTDGSHSVRSFFDVMRQAGATARSMLILAAAQKWGVAPSECQTDLHTVTHPPTGRRLGYGELASAASELHSSKWGCRLKSRGQWRYIG